MTPTWFPHAVGILPECDLTAVVVGGEVIIAPYDELV